jgi:hypothetical protein
MAVVSRTAQVHASGAFLSKGVRRKKEMGRPGRLDADTYLLVRQGSRLTRMPMQGDQQSDFVTAAVPERRRQGCEKCARDWVVQGRDWHRFNQ